MERGTVGGHGQAVALIGSLFMVTAARAEPTQELSPNAAYAEWIGAAQTYTLNYDRLIVSDVFVRVGFSYISAKSIPWVDRSYAAAMIPGATLWQFPIIACYLGIRRHRHVLELGAGAAITHVGHAGSTDGTGVYGEGCVGYRYHPLGEAGFQFRAGVALSVGTERPLEYAIGASPYLSVGAAFRRPAR